MCNIVKVLELSGQEAQGFTQPFSNTCGDTSAHKRAEAYKTMLFNCQTQIGALISGTQDAM